MEGMPGEGVAGGRVPGGIENDVSLVLSSGDE